MIGSIKSFVLILLGFLCLEINTLSAQYQTFNDNRERFQIRAQRTVDAIKIDGILDEQSWSRADVAKDFFLVLPIDSGQAISQTEVMITYDDTEFYMAIVCHDTVAGKRPAESLRRDFSFGKNDNFLSFIDTYSDQTNGFSFGISAAGAQWDGLQANGGSVSLDWDCKWRSAVHNGAEKWIAEFAIPFRSIRYKDGVKEWGINFSRLDLKTAEKSSWAPVPRQFPTANLAFTGTLVWDEPPPKLGARFSLIPYGAVRSSRNAEVSESMSNVDFGLDAKATVSTSLNLDVTVNPDFSQVEVDRQVTNLDRFELFFPERRQFFLENSDLFASLGSENIRPFFSRRIGLESPVQAGMRLSGKLGKDWRLGLMNMQTGSRDDIPSANFTVAALQKKVFDRSNIGVFLVNKSITGQHSEYTGNDQNAVAGLDFNLASKDSRWTGKAFLHQSYYPGTTSDALAWSTAVNYSTQRWQISLQQASVGEGYIAETGFVRRTGYFQVTPEIGHRFYPQSSKIANHGPSAQMDILYSRDGQLTDRLVTLGYAMQMLDRSALSVFIRESFVRLTADFDPTNTGGKMLLQNNAFSWQEAILEYSSNARSLFNYAMSLYGGSYYNGERFGTEGTFNYRVQPYGSLGLVAAYNRISLPEPFNDADLVLIGPKLDLTFTDKIFFTSFVQYNNQIDNVNVNLRFQWRYAPVSDLFLVYTDNTNTMTGQNRNRAFVAKLSYYFN